MGNPEVQHRLQALYAANNNNINKENSHRPSPQKRGNYRRSMGDAMLYKNSLLHKSHKLGLKNRQFNNGAPIQKAEQKQENGQNGASKPSQRRVGASHNIYAKRYSMAATASLKDIEQIRQKQKEEKRERKRLEMIETQKKLEEIKKNEVYNNTLSNNQQQRPNMNDGYQHYGK